MRDDLLRVYFETANASRWLKNGREQRWKRGQHRMRGQQTAGILTKDLRHRGIGKHSAEALFPIERSNAFPDYGAVKICLLRDE